MTLEQLIKLSKNPGYKLSTEQIKMLEEYRTEEFNKVKHSSQFKKHETQLKKEH